MRGTRNQYEKLFCALSFCFREEAILQTEIASKERSEIIQRRTVIFIVIDRFIIKLALASPENHKSPFPCIRPDHGAGQKLFSTRVTLGAVLYIHGFTVSIPLRSLPSRTLFYGMPRIIASVSTLYARSSPMPQSWRSHHTQS